MISPDVDSAVARLEREGVLGPTQARLFGRVARGELVSLAIAIQVLLYLGVTALTSGVGLLFKDQLANLGPLAIASGVGAISAVCFFWVGRRSPAFSAREVTSPHFAFDTILVLGALLASADLAFVESRFSPLGDRWPLHLLVVSAFYVALALRFDSRTLFALSLTTFAAWRGVASTSMERTVFGLFSETDAIRVNALGCGIVFVLLGLALLRGQIKVHFEPTATHLGWLLVLQAIAWGIDSGPLGPLHRLALIVVGVGLAWRSWREGRFALFVFGVLAAYLGVMVGLADGVDETTTILFLVAVSAVALVFGLAAIHRRFPKEAEE